MQASLAVVGSLLAVAAWLLGAGLIWLLAGLVLGSVVPFTLIVMWPTNKRLEDPGLDTATELARSLLALWTPSTARSGAQPARPDPDAIRLSVAVSFRKASKPEPRLSFKIGRCLPRSLSLGELA